MISRGVVEVLKDVEGGRLRGRGAEIDQFGSGAALRLPGRVHDGGPPVIDWGHVVEKVL